MDTSSQSQTQQNSPPQTQPPQTTPLPVDPRHAKQIAFIVDKYDLHSCFFRVCFINLFFLNRMDAV